MKKLHVLSAVLLGAFLLFTGCENPSLKGPEVSPSPDVPLVNPSPSPNAPASPSPSPAAPASPSPAAPVSPNTPAQSEYTLTVGTEEYPTVAAAVDWINDKTVSKSTKFTILIAGDESAPPLTISGPVSRSVTGVTKTLVIKPKTPSGAHTISLSRNGTLFTVESGAALGIEKGIVLKGRATNTGPLVKVQGGFTLADGAGISANTNNAADGRGGGIFVASGGEALVEGRIDGCSAALGGGIYVAGDLALSGNVHTSENTATKGPGVFNGGTLRVSGSARIAEERGVYLADGNTVIIDGALTPQANSNSGGAKSFDLVVQNPGQSEPFLEDEIGNDTKYTIASEDGEALPPPSAVAQGPVLVGGMGKLHVTWQRSALATVYEVWYGTTDDPAAAVKWSTNPSGTSADIDGVEDSTAYYVWVKAKNAAGTSAFSPASNMDSTGDPLPSDMWGKYDSGFGMGEGTGDCYRLIEETGRLLYGTFTDVGDTTGYAFKGPIMYHKSFGVETTGGALTTTGLCGIIIIKFDGRKYPGLGSSSDYYGIYYWGWGHIYNDERILFMANAWPIVGQNAPPIVTPTLKHAKDIFTADNRPKYLYGNVMPQKRVEE